jgi:hypothetical protein
MKESSLLVFLMLEAVFVRVKVRTDIDHFPQGLEPMPYRLHLSGSGPVSEGLPAL